MHNGQERRCTTNPDTGEERCEYVGSSTPPVLDTVTVNGNRAQTFDPIIVTGIRPPPDTYNRWLYDQYNRTSTTVPPADVGGFGGRNGSGSSGKTVGGDASCKGSTPTGAVGGIGNPIIPSTGNKIEAETDFVTQGEVPLYLQRTYNHYRSEPGIFGKYWISNFDLSLMISADGQRITALRNDGSKIEYVYRTTPSAAWWEDQPTPMSRIQSDGGGGYVLYPNDLTVETYNAAGQITSQKNARGIGLTFSYSGGLLYRATHTSGRYVQFYWTGNRLTSVVDPAGNAYGYGYNLDTFGSGLHRLASTAQPGSPGTTITYHYTRAGDPGALTGKSYNGVRYSTFAYDSNGRASLSEHTNGVDRNTFTYTDTGNGGQIVLHTNPLGRQTTYRFQDGKLQFVTAHGTTYCPLADKSVTYDANGYQDSVINFRGAETDYDYNALGQLLKKVEAKGTPQARETTYAWDGLGRMTRETVSGWSQIEYAYRADGLLSSKTTTNLSPYGVYGQTRSITYSYTFHGNGLLATVTQDGPLSGSGDAITSTFDAVGNLTQTVNSLGHATTYSNFNGLGQAGRVVGPNGATMDRTYDVRGRLMSETRWVGGTAYATHMVRDDRGRITRITTPDGEWKDFNYDVNDLLTSIVIVKDEEDGLPETYAEQSTQTQLFTYNATGDLTSTTVTYRYRYTEWDEDRGKPLNASFFETQYKAYVDYDEAGRVRARRGENGQNFRYTYDGEGNLVTTTDSLGRQTSLQYDALNRVTQSTDPKGGITYFQYNKGDQITLVTDPRSLATSYVYDGFGQLWAQQSPDTGTTSYVFSSDGLRTSMTRNDGSWLSYAYDGLGRLTWLGTDTIGRALSYDWCGNGKGMLCGLSANDPGSADAWTHFGYTPEGQLTVRRDSIRGSDDWTGYSYNGMGQLTGISYPSGVNVGYGYSRGRLGAITATFNGATHTVATIGEYQSIDGPPTWINYGNDTWRLSTLDTDRRLTRNVLSGVGVANLQDLNYAYNANNEIVGITNALDATMTQTFGYDALSRLTSVQASNANQTLQYDASNNLTNHQWTLPWGAPAGSTHQVEGNSNRVTNDNIAYVYDGRGNRQVQSWGGSTATFTYDAFNALRQASRDTTTPTYWNPSADASNYPAGTTTYTTNALGQRVAKNGPLGSSRHIYDGQTQLLAEATNGAWSSYIWNDGELIGLVRNNQLYYVHGDHLGRPEIVTNASRAVVWRAKNYAQDRQVAQDSIGGLNIGFPGQYYDAETGLWYNGFRYYDSRVGKYIQSDPIGLAGGINTYAYVGGNPVNLVDPLGLQGYPTSQNPWTRIGNAYNYGMSYIRGPDYVRGSVNAYVATGSITVARNGRVYVSGGVARNYPSPLGLGANASVGYLNQCDKPSDNELTNYLTGPGASVVGAYRGIGGGIGWSPGAGTSTEVGVGLGGGVGGVGGDYGFQVPWRFPGWDK